MSIFTPAEQSIRALCSRFDSRPLSSVNIARLDSLGGKVRVDSSGSNGPWGWSSVVANDGDREHSDAFVFFGATGDLAYKKIFPALQRMVHDGILNVPVIGVAKSGWTLEAFQNRARDSVMHHGGLDERGFHRLLELLRYIDADYTDAATFR